MRRFAAFTCLCLLGMLHAAERAPVLLISLDGFRWDYLDKYAEAAPRLRALRAAGTAAEGLIPAFPSNTFPNHYTVVTGLRPSHHGVTNNEFLDQADGKFFRYNQPASVREGRWWGGEPVWVTAIRNGRKASAAFWVGSEAEIRGIRPTHFRAYDYRIPFQTRVDEVMGWLTGPTADRPAIVCFYFEETNAAGHRHGPDSPEVRAAVQTLDAGVGVLIDRLAAAGVVPNVVVVSDHGMTATSRDRVVILEDHLPAGAALIESDGSVVALHPQGADLPTLERLAARIPHARAYRADQLPAHLHVRPGPRVAPLWILPEEGWQAVTRAAHERLLAKYREQGYLRGDHGYDPTLVSMHGLLVAQGPDIRRGVTVPRTENIHVYPLLCALLGVTPAPNDGDDRLVRAALVPPAR